MRILLLSFYLLGFGGIFSLQAQYQIEQLENRLEDASVSEKLVIYETLTELYLAENPNETITYGNQAIALIDGLKSVPSFGSPNWDTALPKSDSKENIDPQQLTKSEVNIYNNIGKAYRLKNNKKRATEVFLYSAQIAEKMGYEAGAREANQNLYGMQSVSEKKDPFKWAKNLGAKIDSFKVGEVIREKSREVSISTLEARAEMARDRGDTEQAINLYLKMVPHYLAANDTLEVADIYNQVAEMYNSLNRVREAALYSKMAALKRSNKSAAAGKKPSARVDSAKKPVLASTETLNPKNVSGPNPSLAVSTPGYRPSRDENVPRVKENTNFNLPSLNYESLLADLQEAHKALQLDSMANVISIRENAREIEMLRAQKQIQEGELLLQGEIMHRQNQFRNNLLIVLALILALAGLLYVLFSSKKKAHQTLSGAYQDLEETHSKLKSAQTQLVEAEKMASLGQLTAGIAHEINNPVNFISGNIAPLQEDYKEVLSILEKYEEIIQDKNLQEDFGEVEVLKKELDINYVKGEIQTLLEGIREGASRTTEIVKGLRDFSRLDELKIRQFDVHNGIDSTLTLLKNKSKDRIKLVRAYGEVPRIDGYPGKLNQVFMNTLNNAMQAIPEKGTITISTHLVSMKKLGKDAIPAICIRIKDTGKGMSEEARLKAFEPFFTTKDVGEGTGLGLAISLGIIEQHKGTIEIESQKGIGTEVIITLPVSQEKLED